MINNNSQNIYGHFIRKAGLILSGLCAIHCLLVPVFITLLPVAGYYIKLNAWLEIIIYLSILFFGGGLMLADYKHHRAKMPLTLFFGGFVLIAASHFSSNLLLSNVLIICGGISFAAGQMLNISLHKKVNKCGISAIGK